MRSTALRRSPAPPETRTPGSVARPAEGASTVRVPAGDLLRHIVNEAHLAAQRGRRVLLAVTMDVALFEALCAWGAATEDDEPDNEDCGIEDLPHDDEAPDDEEDDPAEDDGSAEPDYRNLPRAAYLAPGLMETEIGTVYRAPEECVR